MTLVRTRVLIINRQVQVAASLKQSLERTGDFEVSVFTTAEAALEHLRTRPYQVVLVDLLQNELPPVDLVLQLRARQPDIAIIASPDQPSVRELAYNLRLHGWVDLPCSLRELIPLLENAAQDALDALPDTASAPAVTVEPEPQTKPQDAAESPPDSPDFSSLDSVLVKMGGLELLGSDTLDLDTGETVLGDSADRSRTLEFVLNGSPAELSDDLAADAAQDDRATFRQLAEEEPPPPGLEDTGTIRDLRTGVSRVNLNQVVQRLQSRPLPLSPLPADEADDDESRAETTPAPVTRPPAGSAPAPAAAILETTLDDSPARPLSLDELLNTLSHQFLEESGGVKPLPSWVEQNQRYVDEPDFLQQPLPPPEVDFADADEADDDANLAVTQPGSAIRAEIEDQPQDMETEFMPAEPEPVPPDDPTTEAAPPITSSDDTTRDWVMGPVTPEDTPPDRVGGPPPDEPRPPRVVETPGTTAPVTLGTEDPDPKIAQLALGLTHFSLESTAQACLLVRAGQIIAYAGSLPLADIESIHQAIGMDWEAQSVQARIRFITPESSDRDYLLYSRRTDAGFTLSMIFVAETPLSAIRRQARRLLEALNNVQERLAAPAAPPDEDDEELQQLERLASEEEQAALESTALVRAQAGEPPAATLEEAMQPTRTVTLTPYTFLWMLADPEQTLTQDVARAIVADLDHELAGQGWRVEQLQVYEDFVYLMADVPVDRSAHEVVRELKQQSAAIAARVNPTLPADHLWGDNYGVLTPGRLLDVEEMQRFVNFVRVH